MSVEFDCLHHEWEKEDWLDSIMEFLETVEAELLCEPEISEDTLFFIFENSIRGIVVTPEKGKADIRLSLLASEVDWSILGGIFNQWLEDGVTILMEGCEEVNQKYMKKEWNDLYMLHTKSGIRSISHIDGEEFSIGLYSAYLTVDKTIIPENPTVKDIKKYMQWLAEKCTRYNLAYPAPTMLLEGDTRISTWSMGDTLINKDVDFIMVYDLENSREGQITPDKLKELMGPLLEITHDSFFIPGLEGKKDKVLIDEISNALRDDLF